MQTNSQKMAQKAYKRITDRKPCDKYRSFARDFPALVHSCGLAQAVAFAQAKGNHHKQYLEDLVSVCDVTLNSKIETGKRLAERIRDEPVMNYLRLSRGVLSAAEWLKRYVDAAKEESGPEKEN